MDLIEFSFALIPDSGFLAKTSIVLLQIYSNASPLFSKKYFEVERVGPVEEILRLASNSASTRVLAN